MNKKIDKIIKLVHAIIDEFNNAQNQAPFKLFIEHKLPYPLDFNKEGDVYSFRISIENNQYININFIFIEDSIKIIKIESMEYVKTKIVHFEDTNYKKVIAFGKEHCLNINDIFDMSALDLINKMS